jgi:hypothetical protein
MPIQIPHKANPPAMIIAVRIVSSFRVS